ncbi:MAG: low molecular weight protein-tyrosine-phosphatase [Bacteroidales bacterium]
MKVLMVCLGNICRSPLAEGILKHKFRNHSIEGVVESAGTAAYHAGEPPDERSRQIALKHGIDLSGQRARKFTREDFDRYDRIFAMDRSNYKDLVSLARGPADRDKVDLIMNTSRPGEDLQVPDPYYGGPDGFLNVYQMLDRACENIVEQVKKFQNPES